MPQPAYGRANSVWTAGAAWRSARPCYPVPAALHLGRPPLRPEGLPVRLDGGQERDPVAPIGARWPPRHPCGSRPEVLCRDSGRSYGRIPRAAVASQRITGRPDGLVCAAEPAAEPGPARLRHKPPCATPGKLPGPGNICRHGGRLAGWAPFRLGTWAKVRLGTRMSWWRHLLVHRDPRARPACAGRRVSADARRHRYRGRGPHSGPLRRADCWPAGPAAGEHQPGPASAGRPPGAGPRWALPRGGVAAGAHPHRRHADGGTAGPAPTGL